MSLYLGIDVGTQGLKAVVYDGTNKSVISRASVPYEVQKSQVPGRAEQQPSLWIEAGMEAIQSALQPVKRKEVKAIGVSGQQHGFVPLDKNGKVIRAAKLWCDVESAPQAQQLSEAWSYTLVPGFTASKILWLQQNEPASYERLAHVLLPHDYFNFFLTGRYVMECGDASGTGFFDAERRCFDDRRMASIDPSLHELLPPLVGPDEAIGTLKPELASQLGLSADTLVAPGSGDNMMSALGSGAVASGVWVVSLGTSGTLFGASAVPVVDPSGTIAPFCDATGQWMPLLCTQNCTGPALEVRQAFGMAHAELTAAAEEVPPGGGGASFLPYLTGERTPNWPHASGALLGLRPGSLRPGVLYRAALEGAAFSLLAGLERLRGFGLSADELRIVGGGSKNALWRRIIADSFRLPLRFPSEPESAALGAALQAAAVHQNAKVRDFVMEKQPPLDDEVVEPNETNANAYAEAFERHTKLGQALFT